MGTYTGQQAVDLVKKHIKGMPLTGVEVILVDQVASIIHFAYPWPWVIKDLTAITLVDGTQDYTVINTDYHHLTSATLARTDCTPDEFRELDIVEFLGKELSQKGGLEQIRKVAPLKGNKLRLERAASVASPAVLALQGEYHPVPTKVTALATVLDIPDHYFTVFTEGLLWRCYKYADDSRAGSIQMVGHGSVVYTGQMGIFYSLLRDMMVSEDKGNGEPMIFPAEPSFGSYSQGSPGLFGV